MLLHLKQVMNIQEQKRQYRLTWDDNKEQVSKLYNQPNQTNFARQYLSTLIDQFVYGLISTGSLQTQMKGPFGWWIKQ